MKCVIGLLVAAISLLLTHATDDPKELSVVADALHTQELSEQPEPVDEDVEEDEEEADEDEEEESDDEEDETFHGRKTIAQILEFCLRGEDITPVQLIDCASNLLIGGGLSPNPDFMKCVGQYMICTQLKCNAVLSDFEGNDKDLSDAFKCLGTCVPQLVVCIARNTPIPAKE